MKISSSDFKKFFTQALKKSLFTRAFVYSFLSFLFLRLLASLVMLIGIFQPSPVAPNSAVSRAILINLETKDFFTRYFLAPWYRWDTIHYLEIADFGYDFDLVNTVWPPFYPFLIKIFDTIFHSSLLSAILVSNIFFILSLFLLYILASDIFDEVIAKKTLFFAITLSSSFFFIAGYSESLFLALSVGVFLFIKKQNWFLAGILASLAALTRVQGVLLVIPIFLELLRKYFKDKNLWNLIKHSISCLYAPMAYGLFSIYVFFGLRADWPWQTLADYWNQRFGWSWEGFYYTFLSLLGKNINIDYTPSLVKVINIVLPLISIYLLFKLRKKIPISLSIYSWILLYMVIGKIDYNNSFVSTTRYLLTVFPIFFALAYFIKNKRANLAWFLINIILQIIFLVYFYWWVWVA
jgi:Gpi18-like mannosyltransferase